MSRHQDDEDLKVARGTKRADRQNNVVSMTPLAEMTKTPKGLLSRRAKFEYGRVTKALSADGLAAEVDRSLLIAYCNEMARYYNLSKEISEAEEILSGTEQNASNLAKIKALTTMIESDGRKRDTALKMSMKLGEMFGLTPAARGKIKVGKKKEKKEGTAEAFDKLMSA